MTETTNNKSQEPELSRLNKADDVMARVNEARGVTGLREFNCGGHSSKDWKTATAAVANATNYMYAEFVTVKKYEDKSLVEIVDEFRKYFKRKASFEVLNALWMITADNEWADMMEARRRQAPK